MSTTLERMADDVFGAVRDYVARNLAPIVRRLDELSAREPAAPVKGLDGKDADEAAIEARVLAKVLKALDDIPPPKDGRDADEAAIEARLHAKLAEAVDRLPAPKDGRDADEAALEARLHARLAEAVDRLPPPKDGKDADAAVVAAEVFERVMRNIRQPADGKSVTLAEAMEHLEPLIEGEISKWELDFERRAGVRIERALDKMREPRDGRDGIGLDGFELDTPDGGRTITLSLRAADGATITRTLRTALTLDRGPYVHGKDYEAGDGVRYGGSFWIAQADTATSPGDSKNGHPWRLAVRGAMKGAAQ